MQFLRVGFTETEEADVYNETGVVCAHIAYGVLLGDNIDGLRHKRCR